MALPENEQLPRGVPQQEILRIISRMQRELVNGKGASYTKDPLEILVDRVRERQKKLNEK